MFCCCFCITLCAQLNSRNSGNSRLWRWFFVMTSLIEAVWRNGLAVLAGLFSKSKWPFQKYPTMISFESPPATNVSLVSDMKFSLLSWSSFRFFVFFVAVNSPVPFFSLLYYLTHLGWVGSPSLVREEKNNRTPQWFIKRNFMNGAWQATLCRQNQQAALEDYNQLKVLD